MKAMILAFVCAALSGFCFAATNTNILARSANGLNGHQQFYTNWIAQYSAMTRIIQTNNAQLSRLGTLINSANIEQYQMNPNGVGSRKTTAAIAAENQMASLKKTADGARRRFEVLVKQRLAYELKYPAAISYAPKIEKWTDLPTKGL